MRLSFLRLLAGGLLLSTSLIASPALAANECAQGKTLTDGVLTIATGNPAYYPWVIDDKPEEGKGFEAAVAYAVAKQMGFAADQVTWVRTSFDEAIQPGEKNFDFNMQQYSITEDREKVVDFSVPYYTAAMAVLVRKQTIEGGLKPDIASLKKLKWGAVGTTTAVPVLFDLVKPDNDPLLYDDTANVAEAMKANQIDAAIFDLPTALYLSAVVVEDGALLGQFAPELSKNPDQFGMLMTEGNPLKECVDAAITALKEDGTLAKLEASWLQEATGVPLIK
ncbi:ABC transporter substrate-binding protein [Pseudahrensia aquimaris]|uniref:ABC transporter substrate-binding protein n=1 Tax=Pseudahrensia aquimaris TaxID=744461 RepID=A0ABW3FEX3_9HYPH